MVGQLKGFGSFVGLEFEPSVFVVEKAEKRGPPAPGTWMGPVELGKWLEMYDAGTLDEAPVLSGASARPTHEDIPEYDERHVGACRASQTLPAATT